MKDAKKWLSISMALTASLLLAVSSLASNVVETQQSSGATASDTEVTPASIPASHIESVPIEDSHSDPIPEMTVKAGTRAKLTGEVEHDQSLNALNGKLGFSVIPEGKELLPGQVTKLKGSSPLVKRGVVDGDRLIGEVKNPDGSITLTMEHGGQAFRFSLSSNELTAAVSTDDNNKPQALQGGTTDKRKPEPLVANVDTKQFKSMVDVMVNHDLALVIDRSGSMTTRDCPGALSRWEWCCVEATELARAAAQASSSIDAAIFNSEYATYKHISPQQIPEIFAYNRPAGGTEPAYALKEQLENYFNSPRSKPLTVVMVTDGMPNHPPNIAAVLQEESAKIRYQGEVTITVLLISNEVSDQRFREICGLTPDSTVRKGGFVDIIPFIELEQKGMVRALFDDLKEARICTDPHKASRASQTALGPQYAPSRYPSSMSMPYGNGIRTYGSGGPGYGMGPRSGIMTGSGFVNYARP